MKITM